MLGGLAEGLDDGRVGGGLAMESRDEFRWKQTGFAGVFPHHKKWLLRAMPVTAAIGLDLIHQFKRWQRSELILEENSKW